jgi:hypothetical protein
VDLVFRLFRETGSAYAVVQGFSQRGLHFPKRAYGGAWDGKLVWGHLTYSRVLSILKNSTYAGCTSKGVSSIDVRSPRKAKLRSMYRRWRCPRGRSACPSIAQDTSRSRNS